MKIFTEYLRFHTKTHRAYIHLTPQVEEIVQKAESRKEWSWSPPCTSRQGCT